MSDEGWAFVIGLIIGATVACAVTAISLTEFWQSDCVEKGFAEHNAKTGEWQWKEQQQ